ncbi:hypothetical protein GGH95_001573 [Coemansia sp. RSA 1836]|nr:hypothetical protein GGH95_001573 [Coemansia sp. RSA 1836]
MGISAIFKRPKATSSSSQASTDESIKDGHHRPRHIKRRPTASGDRSSEERVRPAVPAPAPKLSSKSATRIISRTPSASDIEEPLTPEDSLSAGRRSSRTRSSATKNIAALGAPPAKLQTDSGLFSLYRLTTPPMDFATPQLREIDPFEDSPPPRPLTDFEDPVYIPPLTLAATLVDDYIGSNSATNATTLATTSGPATASTFSRSSTAAAAAGNSMDLLSEFNASYNYLFGTLPSDSALAASTYDTSTSNVLGRASATPAATTTPPRQNAKYARTTDTGLLSPVSAQTVGSGSSAANAPDESAEEEEEDAASLESSSPSEDSAVLRELDEERRKEEERKAAEQRNRRRELIKQQVAFERMKERHRRQYPGQQQPVSTHNSVARWQKESASAVAPQAMYASNRGYSQALPPHHTANQPHVAAPHGSASFPNLQANASMPNMAYMADPQYATFPRHKHQGFPLIDAAAARAGTHSAPFVGHAPPASGYQMQPLQLQPPAPSAHPVKLASMPQRAKNPYLSDSSNDDVDDDGSDSDDLTSIGSSDISCDPPLEPREPGTASLGITSASTRVPRSVSQPISPSGRSDASSDTSAKSQSSSIRRVRFHETVSVVFNTRHTVAGEDLEQDAHESDNDSSNASIDLNATSTSTYSSQPPPPRQVSATTKGSGNMDSISTFDVPAKAAQDDDDNSDGDDVPLSAFTRSRSEPMSNLPRRSTDDYLSRLATFSSNYDSDSNKKDAAKSANPRRFFGRNQADIAGNPIARSNTQSSAPAPKVEEHVAKFEQMRSLSMDVAPRQATEKRRFGRWGNFF